MNGSQVDSKQVNTFYLSKSNILVLGSKKRNT